VREALEIKTQPQVRFDAFIDARVFQILIRAHDIAPRLFERTEER
jgi:hypothetical protein